MLFNFNRANRVKEVAENHLQLTYSRFIDAVRASPLTHRKIFMCTAMFAFHGLLLSWLHTPFTRLCCRCDLAARFRRSPSVYSSVQILTPAIVNELEGAMYNHPATAILNAVSLNVVYSVNNPSHTLVAATVIVVVAGCVYTSPDFEWTKFVAPVLVKFMVKSSF